jgi:pimeloyl-ACP methyl ester carboxylesterase
MPSPKPVLLLIPGLLCDQTVWRGVAERLEDICAPRVVEGLDAFDSVQAMARAALDAMEGPFAVAGFSFGGRIAFEMTRIAPQRVRRMAVLDTGFNAVQPHEEASRMGLVRLARERGMAALVRVWLPPMLLEAHRDDPAIAGPLEAMALRRTPQSFENQQRAALTRPDATPHLGAIAVPMLIMVGRDDAWSPVAQHEDLHRRIPGSRLVIVEDSGHFAPVEQPEAVAAAMRDWLAA